MRARILGTAIFFVQTSSFAGIGSQAWGENAETASRVDPLGGIALLIILAAVFVSIGPWKFLRGAAVLLLIVCASMAPLLVIATVFGFFQGSLNKNILVMAGVALTSAVGFKTYLHFLSKSESKEADKTEIPSTSTQTDQPTRSHKQPPTRTNLLNGADENLLIGGVMSLREAHERVCRAHDEQTAKLKVALAELSELRTQFNLLQEDVVALRDENQRATAKAANQACLISELELKLDTVTAERDKATAEYSKALDAQKQAESEIAVASAEMALLKSKFASPADHLTALRQELRNLDSAISATSQDDYATVESLKKRRGELAGGLYRLHILSRGATHSVAPRAEYTDGVHSDLTQCETLPPARKELTGILQWPKPGT